LNRFISANAAIIHSPHFESGVVKIMKDVKLKKDEENACKSLMQKSGISSFIFLVDLLVTEIIDDLDELSVDNDEDFANLALMNYAKDSAPVVKYIPLNFILCSSSIVESFFSTTEHVFGSRRAGTLPIHVEEQMFLLKNRQFWTQATVASAVTKLAAKKKPKSTLNEAEPRSKQAKISDYRTTSKVT
jgi:hypothetical protein